MAGLEWQSLVTMLSGLKREELHLNVSDVSVLKCERISSRMSSLIWCTVHSTVWHAAALLWLHCWRQTHQQEPS